MLPTYVFGWPTGQETGEYLALDLGMLPIIPYVRLLIIPCLSIGGTNLRVCLVTLMGEGKFEVTQSKYRLTEEQKHSDGSALFDFCADCLKTFIDNNFEPDSLKPNELLPLGFTVSESRRISFTLYLSSNALASSRTLARKLCISFVSPILTRSKVRSVSIKQRLSAGQRDSA